MRWQLFPSIHAVIPYQWSCTTTLMLSTKDNTTFDNRTKTLPERERERELKLNSLKERKDWALFSFPWELLKSCFLLSTASLFSLKAYYSSGLQKQGSYEYKCMYYLCIFLHQKRRKNEPKCPFLWFLERIPSDCEYFSDFLVHYRYPMLWGETWSWTLTFTFWPFL